MFLLPLSRVYTAPQIFYLSAYANSEEAGSAHVVVKGHSQNNWSQRTKGIFHTIYVVPCSAYVLEGEIGRMSPVVALSQRNKCRNGF